MPLFALFDVKTLPLPLKTLPRAERNDLGHTGLFPGPPFYQGTQTVEMDPDSWHLIRRAIYGGCLLFWADLWGVYYLVEFENRFEILVRQIEFWVLRIPFYHGRIATLAYLIAVLFLLVQIRVLDYWLTLICLFE